MGAWPRGLGGHPLSDVGGSARGVASFIRRTLVRGRVVWWGCGRVGPRSLRFGRDDTVAEVGLAQRPDGRSKLLPNTRVRDGRRGAGPVEVSVRLRALGCAPLPWASPRAGRRGEGAGPEGPAHGEGRRRCACGAWPPLRLRSGQAYPPEADLRQNGYGERPAGRPSAGSGQAPTSPYGRLR